MERAEPHGGSCCRGNRAAVGMGLLSGHDLSVEVVENGVVKIEELV